MITRFVCLSDTHNLHLDLVLPEGDVALVAGDITNVGDLEDVKSFAQWVTSLIIMMF
jgi:coenzyme F420-reducing hydrogenase gamma subunit